MDSAEVSLDPTGHELHIDEPEGMYSCDSQGVHLVPSRETAALLPHSTQPLLPSTTALLNPNCLHVKHPLFVFVVYFPSSHGTHLGD